jgi:hypothetical protein
MKTILYHTVNASTAAELDKAVNGLLEEGYQLFGSPYLSDRPIEGMVGNMAFYQAMTLEKETSEEEAALIKQRAQSIEIKELKMIKPN